MKIFSLSSGMGKWISISVACSVMALVSGCAHRQALSDFSDRQKNKMSEKTAFIEAEFDFWAAAYEPTVEDLEAFKMAWVQHGDAFPDSKDYLKVSTALGDSRNRVVMLAIFMNAYDRADIKDKSMGWTIYPVPASITELSDGDEVIRALMPVTNAWVRYFMIKYNAETWLSAPTITVGNRNTRVDLAIRKYLKAL